ncbi:MAG TPA: DUF4198 domain-containing protein [Rudaea sp.]|nr:DUF4198 domain-containing protein [Rudaea sp.]
MPKPAFTQYAAALGAAVMLTLPLAAHAHRTFLLPSTTLADKAGAVVTFDTSATEELFVPDHAVQLEKIAVDGPGNARPQPENTWSGKQRSSFELKLPDAGTYRVALINDGLSAMYKVDGQVKRWRGNAESFAKEVPANAQDLNVMRMQSRNETFVRAGDEAGKTEWKTSGVGIEMTPLSSPTELFKGDTTSLRFTLNGKPAADLTVTVIRGGNRYRDALGEITLKTDRDGKISIRWPDAGMYWIGASTGRPPQGASGTLAAPIVRASYSATLEVLQP